MEVISDSKLTLKPFEEDHLLEFVEAVRESVGVWMTWSHQEYSEADTLSWFELCQLNIENQSAYDIGIFLTKTNQLVGGISINQISRQNNLGNIGYWVRESNRNQGIALNAVDLITTFGFNELGLTRLEIVVLEDNKASRKIAEKAGAKFECIAENRLIHNGKARPAAVYSLVPQ